MNTTPAPQVNGSNISTFSSLSENEQHILGCPHCYRSYYIGTLEARRICKENVRLHAEIEDIRNAFLYDKAHDNETINWALEIVDHYTF